MTALTRRRFTTGGALALAGAVLGAPKRAPAQAAPASVGPPDPALVEDLVAANRILADQNVLDRRTVALMRGHGAVIVGPSLPVAVFRSVYLETNARLQAQAMAQGAHVRYLEAEEARLAEASVAGTLGRPWELWKRKALGK